MRRIRYQLLFTMAADSLDKGYEWDQRNYAARLLTEVSTPPNQKLALSCHSVVQSETFMFFCRSSCRGKRTPPHSQSNQVRSLKLRVVSQLTFAY